MTLAEYYEELTNLIKRAPGILDYSLVYAKDDEGNEYNKVNYTPSVGFYDPDNYEFSPITNKTTLCDTLPDENLVKVICLN